jgi:DNA-directed RNA polymerase specialized sigma subunit
VLESPRDVIRCLLTYTDWWQPSSTSVLQVGGRRTRADGDGFNALALLDTLDERDELCRRMEYLPERDRHLLFLWYVEQRAAHEIARALRISRRHCFRLRQRSIDKIVKLGEEDEAA